MSENDLQCPNCNGALSSNDGHWYECSDCNGRFHNLVVKHTDQFIKWASRDELESHGIAVALLEDVNYE